MYLPIVLYIDKTPTVFQLIRDRKKGYTRIANFKTM